MDNNKKNIIGAITQATLVTVVGYPFDLVKTQLQANKNTSTLKCVHNIIKQGGLKNLYRGSAMPWISHMIKRPIQYPLSEYLQTTLKNNGYILPHYNYIVGGISGVYGSMIGTPLQVVKVSIQTHNNSKNSLDYIKHNLKKNGVKGFYRGFIATATKDFMFGSCFIGTYYTLRDMVGNDIWWKTFISGSIAQSFTWSLLIPADFVKTSIQKSEIKISVRDVVKANYNNYGIKVFWKGVIPACIRTIPVSGIGMVGYETVRRYLDVK
jgi:hypothetical protein